MEIDGLFVIPSYPNIIFFYHGRELLLGTRHGNPVHSLDDKMLITDTVKLEVQIRTHLPAIKKKTGSL